VSYSVKLPSAVLPSDSKPFVPFHLQQESPSTPNAAHGYLHLCYLCLYHQQAVPLEEDSHRQCWHLDLAVRSFATR
jgi:hypothetical protein